jgi:SAM-dependent methyltransferase
MALAAIPYVDDVITLADLVARLADRRATRTEANVQSDLHMLLTIAPFELDDSQVKDIVLESPAGDRRRIDVEVGQTVFEVKRDLRAGHVREDAVEQLAGYVRGQTTALGQRYVGVLTDGAEWHLYHLIDGTLHLVSSLEVTGAAPDTDGLVVWLESVLATASRLRPTPTEIVRRLGAASPAHDLDAMDLAALYRANRDLPEVKLKRELWAKLLTTALGTNFADEDDLFVEHTLLVVTAEIIAHAVVGIDPTDATIGARALLEGRLFATAQVGGVVEPDFFDWIAAVDGGEAFIRTLARRLSRFEWGSVEHDVMKVLYESVIAAETRHSLGEYYTPDWLASEVVEAVVSEPLTQRVLDPACGSGTFLFHAVRQYLAAADEANVPPSDALVALTSRVTGVDVHPVAVTLARVTYLLAIGMDRLRARDRPAFSVPVYLGDSVQWGQQQTLLTAEGLTVPTADGAQLFADELRFPDRLLDDAARFDRLVAELADRAAQRAPGSSVPSLATTFRRAAVHPDDQPMVERTFATMCRLHDEGRDHIWGYYVRNLARPIWLAQRPNRVDVLVGNPPWLAYRFMTAAMQATFRDMSTERGMWAGASVATHQDLSGLFVARTVELYLRDGGRFGFVMPLATLSRRQFAGFRTGQFGSKGQAVTVAFGQSWDLHLVKPSFFPVPASVVFGERSTAGARAMPAAPQLWSGRLPASNVSMDVAREHLTQTDANTTSSHGAGSAYASRFSQGATVVPRVLLIVEEQPAPAMGVGAGRVAVRSRRSPKEKRPWKTLASLTGVVERQFVHPLVIGETVLPYRLRDPLQAIVPWDGSRLLAGTDEQLDLYPGLATWWRQAEATWESHRSSERLALRERMDFRKGLSQQFPTPEHRIVYSASGMYLAAARLSDQRAVVEHKLYWGAAATVDEALYLVTVLNSDAVTQAVRPLQARGEHNPRDFDKYVWRVPIPMYNSVDPRHAEVAKLGELTEGLVASIELPGSVSFEALRRRVREAVAGSSLGRRIEEVVSELLGLSQL